MNNSVVSAPASLLILSKLFDPNADVPNNSTLNQQLSVFANVDPDTDATASINYFGIGIGGHTFDHANHSVLYNERDASNSNLVNQIPFVIRPLTNDLNASQRSKYRIRKKIIIDGTDMYAYYLKKLGSFDRTPTLSHIDNGTSVVFPLSNASSTVRNPLPVISSVDVPIALSANDVEGIINSCILLFNESGHAFVSELAVYHGSDKDTEDTAGNTYKEVVNATMVSSVNVAIPMVLGNPIQSLIYKVMVKT